MVRWALGLCVLVAAGLTLGVAVGGEYKSKVKSVDAAKRTITITTYEGKEMTYPVERGAEVYYLVKAAKKKSKPDHVNYPGGLKSLKPGAEVIVITEKDDAGQEQAIMIQVGYAEELLKKKK